MSRGAGHGFGGAAWGDTGAPDAALVVPRRRATLVVALVGMAVCALAGGPVLVLSVLGALGIVAGRLLGRDTPRAAARWRVLNTSALVACLLAAFASVPLLVVGAGLVAWLQVHRAFTGASASDDRTALLLALLQALLGCVLSVSLLLAPLFLVLVVLAPVALALCHLGIELEAARAARIMLGGERRPTRLLWGLGPAALVLTALFFVGLPRLSGGPTLVLDEPERITGFGDDVDLGDLGEMLESDALVMRLRVSTADGQPWNGPLYLRGAALDTFDGERWTSSAGRGGRWRPLEAEAGEVLRQEVLLEPLSEKAIFGLHELVRVDGLGRSLQRDANGALRYQGQPGRIEYTAWSRLPTADPSELRSARPDPRLAARSRGELAAADAGLWLQLPADLDPRVPALADRLAAAAGPDASAWEQAVAIAAGLQRDWSYSLTPPPPPDGLPPEDPLAWFLFDAREGHCEYFATALAVMLRSRGIPARVVNGFLGGELNPLGGWVLVRQRDAHSWVEVNLGRHGWVPFDATPAGGDALSTAAPWSQAWDWLERRWHGVVLDYELNDQLGLLARVGRSVAPPGQASLGELAMPEVGGLVAVVLAVGLAAALLRTGLRFAARVPSAKAARGRVDRVHDRAWRFVRRRGWTPPPALPPVEAAAWVVARAGDAARPLEELAWLRYQVRYGGGDDEASAAQARQAWQRLRSSGLPRMQQDDAGEWNG